jgi:glycine/D-amino acid oxidase-like deaminating enzyme
MTPDGVPVIDNVEEIAGRTLAVGMCGQGFMLGIGVGQSMASRVVDGKHMLPPEAVEPICFERDYWKAKTQALK